jgi:hypothetical protein
MNEMRRPVTDPIFLAKPHDPIVRSLFDYWNALRGDRPMPRRADVDPVAIPKLLPNIVMYTALPEGGYAIRLVGEEVARYAGRNATGEAAGAIMPPRAREILVEILDAVVADRSPKFRLGKAHWQPDKGHREFEACFLPLSADDEGSVAIILCGIAFSDWRFPDAPPERLAC